MLYGKCSVIGLILVSVGSLSTVIWRRFETEAVSSNRGNERYKGSAENLPAGLERSDWNSILDAHQAWKYEVRATKDGWRAHNEETGLTATFDRRGMEVRPQSADWSWGLELASYGAGAEQVAIDGRVPEVRAAGPRVSYQWDDNIEEWYQNDSSGLEHGYTIQQRPATTAPAEPLSLHLRLNGGLRVTGPVAGRDLAFGKTGSDKLLRYSGLKVFDANGQELNAEFEANGDRGIRILVEDDGAAYPLTIDPTLSQQAYLKPTNTGAGDYFGYSVAISGDTVVVGATREDSSGTGGEADNSVSNAGAAYVFVRSGTTWSQQAYLKASNADADDQFGYYVAISGDTIVVAAAYEDGNRTGGEANNTASNAGAAYVFVRSGTSWSQQAYLKASNTGAGDFFGTSVAISGETIVVSAPYEASNGSGENNNSSSAAGAAYVFVRSGTTWSQQAYLKASNPASGDYFGWSVSISGDSVVVGAHQEDSNGTGGQADNSAADAGAVYVFVRSGTTWSQQEYLKASTVGAGDYFGAAVAISGETIVVGAYREDSNGTGGEADNSASDAGAAYVFVRSGTSWSQQAYLKASNAESSDFFGFSVVIAGDTVVIGAPQEDSSATGVDGNETNNSVTNAGAAYVYVRSGTSCSKQAYLKSTSDTPLRAHETKANLVCRLLLE